MVMGIWEYMVFRGVFMRKKVKKILILCTFPLITVSVASSCKRAESASAKIDNIQIVDSSKEEYENNFREHILALKQNYKTNILGFAPDEKAKILNLGMKYFTSPSIDKQRDINMINELAYSDLPGVTCFRGNNMRDGGNFGTAEIKQGKLELQWKKKIGSIDEWTGVGWNGQPSIVQWDKKVINSMNINTDKKNKENLRSYICNLGWKCIFLRFRRWKGN
jgi:hypothetical protein